jgi:hypothetical protein
MSLSTGCLQFDGYTFVPGGASTAQPLLRQPGAPRPVARGLMGDVAGTAAACDSTFACAVFSTEGFLYATPFLPITSLGQPLPIVQLETDPSTLVSNTCAGLYTSNLAEGAWFGISPHGELSPAPYLNPTLLSHSLLNNMAARLSTACSDSGYSQDCSGAPSTSDLR